MTYTDDSLSETRDFYQSSSWQVLEERISGTTPDRQYVWGLRYIDDLVLRDRSTGDETLNERLYGLQDANWNVVALSDTSGTVQKRIAYSAYGVVLPLNPDFSDYTGSGYDWTVLYTGRELDIATGLMYYRMRYYHPLLGVFVSRDPLDSRLGTNLNEFSGDAPVNSLDPNGTQSSVSSPTAPQLIFTWRPLQPGDLESCGGIEVSGDWKLVWRIGREWLDCSASIRNFCRLRLLSTGRDADL